MYVGCNNVVGFLSISQVQQRMNVDGAAIVSGIYRHGSLNQINSIIIIGFYWIQL